MIDELMAHDRVEHTASGSTGVVLEVKTRWSVPAARVRFDDTGFARWVPRAVLRRLSQERSS